MIDRDIYIIFKYDRREYIYIYPRLSYLNIILRRYLVPPNAPVLSVFIFGRVHAPFVMLIVVERRGDL